MRAAAARHRGILVAVVVAALALGLLLRSSSQRVPEPAAASANALLSSAPRHDDSHVDTRTGPSPRLLAESRARVASVRKLEAALETFLRNNQYPPWSRPIDEGTRYKLQWNVATTSELRLSDEPGMETQIAFRADRAHVMFNEPLVTWIEVWRKGDPSNRIPATIVSAWVISTRGTRPGRAVELQYRDDGGGGDEVAGDRRYTNRFVPAEHAELRTPQQVQIHAVVEADGVRTMVSRDFTYTPRPILDLLSIEDGLRKGHLVISLSLDVYESGLFTFEANLMSGDGETALVYADESIELQAGRRTASLRFFGKAIVDKGLGGPYQVRDIRAVLRASTPSEDNLRWFSDRTHVTKGYALDAFSAAAWDAPEKREKTASFRELIEQTRAGELDGEPSPHLHIGADGVAREVSP
ncbi:MAG: choice-of-anchor X domain-containing protein [Myxococcota bacterium]